MQMISTQLTAKESGPLRAQAAGEKCLGCHREILAGYLVKDGIRVEHAQMAKAGISCTECHNEVAHGKAVPLPKRPTMDKCTGCHKGEKGKTVDCKLCHVGSIGRSPTEKVGSWAANHADAKTSSHGMGELSSCTACHSSRECGKCHIQMPHPEGWPYDHGKTAVEQKGGERCDACHLDSFCDSCHGIKMPHQSGFVRFHSSVAKRLGGVCYKCHVKDDCLRCHERHVHPGGVVPMKDIAPLR